MLIQLQNSLERLMKHLLANCENRLKSRNSNQTLANFFKTYSVKFMGDSLRQTKFYFSPVAEFTRMNMSQRGSP